MLFIPLQIGESPDLYPITMIIVFIVYLIKSAIKRIKGDYVRSRGGGPGDVYIDAHQTYKQVKKEEPIELDIIKDVYYSLSYKERENFFYGLYCDIHGRSKVGGFTFSQRDYKVIVGMEIEKAKLGKKRIKKIRKYNKKWAVNKEVRYRPYYYLI